eukprot:scaffold1665_cov149-Skeletonema_menzelii.AAC.4
MEVIKSEIIVSSESRSRYCRGNGKGVNKVRCQIQALEFSLPVPISRLPLWCHPVLRRSQAAKPFREAPGKYLIAASIQISRLRTGASFWLSSHGNGGGETTPQIICKSIVAKWLSIKGILLY